MPKKLIQIAFLLVALLIFTGCTSGNSEPLVPTSGSDITNDNAVEQETSDEEQPKKEEIKQQNPLDKMIVHYIDVGQADATLLQFGDEDGDYTMLIDTGNWNATDVVDYLHAENISDIDIIAISHPHADHIGQLDKIINAFDVGEVWMNGEVVNSEVFDRALAAIENHEVDYDEPAVGDVFDVGPVTVEIIHPDSLAGGINDNSLSMRLQYGDVSFLFTGDAERQAESGMLSRNMHVQAAILHLGHHGSKTSTNDDFLTAVNPEIAIYSAGVDNQYGHPDQEVVDRVNAFGALLYGTDTHGTIRLETDGVTYTIQTHLDGTLPRVKEEIEVEEKVEDVPVSTGTCVDINHATLEELQQIMHIGIERAALVIEQRPYQSIDQLSKVNGIGPARIQDIKAQGIACTGGD